MSAWGGPGGDRDPLRQFFGVDQEMDASGNFYQVGFLRLGATVDIDFSANIHNITSIGDYDGFVMKYNTNFARNIMISARKT